MHKFSCLHLTLLQHEGPAPRHLHFQQLLQDFLPHLPKHLAQRYMKNGLLIELLLDYLGKFPDDGSQLGSGDFTHLHRDEVIDDDDLLE